MYGFDPPPNTWIMASNIFRRYKCFPYFFVTYIPVVFSLRYVHPWGYAKTSYAVCKIEGLPVYRHHKTRFDEQLLDNCKQPREYS
jgi:hypothetical protein